MDRGLGQSDGKMNLVVGEKNRCDHYGGKKYLFRPFRRQSSGHVLGAFYWQLTMGRKDTSFGGKLKYLLVRRKKLNHTEMLVGTHIYLKYVLTSIILITVMLVIGLFYPTQLHSFIECYFEYLPIFITYRFTVFT